MATSDNFVPHLRPEEFGAEVMTLAEADAQSVSHGIFA
jgi:hypothetical protein